ncbi:MAG TPA: sugar ABC transporter ATP-binding protein [Planctomycetaceae bacterium]|nr:sugar ABC transporter ATP-binding protein [Planctomycetaceae bacterium]
MVVAGMIEFDRITKRFPGVAALTDVSFGVRRGECHALLGENGAGKSTLGKILAGLYRPDGGSLRLDGRTAAFYSARDALLAGVGIVHQELVFCPQLSVAENLCLHDLPKRGWGLDRRELYRRAEKLLTQIGLAIDVRQPIANLSIGQEQMVQIAAAVGLGARVLVFDEPTSSLGRGEVERLFALLRRLRQEGVTIIYVSHRLEEIFELCQTVTVLRDGRHVATRPVAEVDHDELVRLMVGRSVEHFSPPISLDGFGPCRLRVRDFSSPGKFSRVTLEVRAGEIVGLAGLVGAGRTEIAEAIAGLDPHAAGTIEIDDRPVRLPSPRTAQLQGIGLIPEDRKRHGLVLGMNVRENITLPVLDRFRQRFDRADRRAETRLAREFCDRLAIRTPGLETAVSNLSGGNQQKIVFAKGLASDCRVLLVDEPTRGVDVGAKREIHELIGRLAAQGVAVLLISSDLPELLALSHRVVVLRAGQIVAELERTAADPETVLRHMTGLSVA